VTAIYDTTMTGDELINSSVAVEPEPGSIGEGRREPMLAGEE